MALINEDTISHGEHTCLYLEKCCENITFIGQCTNGTNGNVSNISLPGNVTVTFTGLGASHSNGERLQRRGIHPHVVVTPTIQDICNNTDKTLQVAVQYVLRNNGQQESGANKNFI